MASTSAVLAVSELFMKQWPLFMSTLVALGAAWLFQKALQHDPLSKIPLVGIEIHDEGKRRAEFMQRAKDFHVEGYTKFKEGLFRVPTFKESPTVIVGPKYLAELKALPDDVLSFSAFIRESMHTKYTAIRADRPLVPHVVKKDLTPALNRLNPVIAEEVDQCFRDELPPCQDYTSVNINQKLLRIVAKVSGRIFIGPELCRTEEYIDTAINYTVELVQAQKAITRIPAGWRRWLKAGSLPEVKTLQQRTVKSRKFMQPIIAERQRAAKEDPDFQRPDDLLQWLLDDGQTKFGKQSDQELAICQLGLTFAAIHTTVMTATNTLYSVAALPDVARELREEIKAVLKEHGTFTTLALQKMKKMDSFMKEVMRTEPLGLASFSRKVLKDFTLSDGQVIPAGCVIEIPAYGAMHDPDFVKDPEVFDPWRWSNMREKEGLNSADKASAGATNQFVSVNSSNLVFGYGRHACPGRFFAANEIKMIVGRALLDYDIKLAGDVKTRYPNLPFADTFVPDPTKEILFKRVAI